MPDEYRMTADALVGGDDEQIFSAIERDARRYNKAFAEEEEARGE